MPKRRRCFLGLDLARVRALLAPAFVLLACDGRFAFDADPGLGTGGAGGSSAGAAGTAASSGVAGSATGGAPALDCDARCRAAQLTCLESRQVCVECVEDEDCFGRGLRRCGEWGQTWNRCLECLYDEDCSAGKQCDPGTHSCVTECTRFGDPVCAASGLECHPWHFYCAACYDGDDCDRVHLRCSVGDARCVQCVDDDECAGQPGKWCDPVTLSCVVCRDSFDCASGKETCDPVAHVCR